MTSGDYKMNYTAKQMCICFFRLHEVGYYDTRNSIDYILNATAKDDLIYIGHSQGTTNFFILVSMLPEYNSKIRVSVNMAPVVFMSHAKGLIIHTVALFERIILVFFIMYII